MRWLSFFICLSGGVYASSDAIPSDMLGMGMPEKKLKNKIFSTVQQNPIHTRFEDPTFQASAPEQAGNSLREKRSMLTSAVRENEDTPIANQFASPAPTTPVASPGSGFGPPPQEAAISSAQEQEFGGVAAEPDVTEGQSFVSPQQAEGQASVGQGSFNPEAKVVGVVLEDTDTKTIPAVSAASDSQPGVLQQSPGFIDDQGSVAFNFEETDLDSVAKYMETIHDIKFVSDDIIASNKDAKGLSGHKITFRTNKVLTKKESWDLFLSFLHIAGLDIVPMAQAGFYRIVPFNKANSEALPSYIGVNSELLPDNDMIVRYVYFLQNIDPTKVQPIITKMQGGSAKLDVFSELKALIFTDRSRNIKSLMQIVHELDQSVLPETLAVIKLKKVNADDVIKLYKSLKSSGGSSSQGPQRAWAPGKKDATLEYFPQDVSTFSDTRTNSLILLGPAKGVKRIEEFIEKHVDVDIVADTPPVFTYQLQYTTASNIQPILQKIVQYGPAGTQGSNFQGGFKDGVQYFQNMTIVPEPHSNKLIINSTPQDFAMLKPLIQELDIPQKQIGLEVLIVQVSNTDTKSLGAQISAPGGANPSDTTNSTCQTFAKSISGQTSGIFNAANKDLTTHVVTQTGSNEYSLKSSLSKLLAGPTVNEAGSILLTFGQPIWAIFKVLKKMTSTQIVANPFMVVANNSLANISTGEARRVISSEVSSGSSSTVRGFTESSAALGFKITPQINKGNVVNMKIEVTNEQFVNSGENDAVKSSNTIDTYASVANGEVLALGGIVAETYSTNNRGVPLLENIPVLGWFFKSKVKSLQKNHFIVFIAPRLMDPVHDQSTVDQYTNYKMEELDNNIKMIDSLDWFNSRKDPIQKAFFKEDLPPSAQALTDKKLRKKKSAPTRSKKKSKKSKKKASVEDISFEKDFLKLENEKNLPVKNSIFNSIRPGKKNV